MRDEFVSIPVDEIPEGVEMNRQEIQDSWDQRAVPENKKLAYEPFPVWEKIKRKVLFWHRLVMIPT